MQNSDRAKFVLAIQALAAAFRAEVSEALLEGYWLALDDLELSAVGAAVKRALRECRFMPAANELRSLAGEVRPAHRAVLAWDAFSAAVVRHGGYASVDFDDPIINATVHSLGGWERCCEMPAAEFDKFLRKDFERVYVALFASGVTADRAGALLGTIARENALNGYEVRPPVKIATGLPAPGRDLIRRSPLAAITNSKPGKIGEIIDVSKIGQLEGSFKP